MSDLQDIIATSSIRAFNHGMQAEREHIIRLLAETKDETLCTCSGCQEWVNAFDYVIARIQNKIPND
jgi:hypothetical protein